jgi:hypothetical protein
MTFQASLALCILGPAASDMALLAPRRDAVRAAVLDSMTCCFGFNAVRWMKCCFGFGFGFGVVLRCVAFFVDVGETDKRKKGEERVLV